MYNTKGEVKSDMIYSNIVMGSSESQYEGISYHEGMDEAIVRKDMHRVRKWLNERFCIPDRYKLSNAKSTLNFLRRNRYFKSIREPFSDKNLSSL